MLQSMFEADSHAQGSSSEEDTFAYHGYGVESAHQTEASPLLPDHDTPAKTNLEDGVHYKNIDGKRFRLLFASVLVAYVLVYFDSFFMASSHPVITSYFGASNAASWLSTVFFLTSIIFGPFYGRISDVTGRKSMYVFALVMFAVTTAWCGAARSIGEFIAARGFCGLGAGGVAVMSNIILSDIIKIEYRGIYQSYLNVCFGLGNGLGASLGGLLADSLGWRAAFFLQVPLILMLLILAIFATPKYLGPSLAKAEDKTIAQALSSFDFAGAAALTLTITGLILGINLGGSILSWTHPLVITALVVCLLAAVELFFVERTATRPLLPIWLLSTIPFSSMNWGNALGSMLAATVNFNVPLFLQAVKQTSPTKSGLLLLSPLVGVSISSVAVGFAISATRKIRPFIAVGVLCMLGGIVACGCLDQGVPVLAVIPIIPWVSIGQGFFFPASTVSTLALSSMDDQAVVVTTLNLSRSLGNILGVAVSSWVLQNALVVFLRKEVSGETRIKDEIMRMARKSIKTIGDLDPVHKKEGTQDRHGRSDKTDSLVVITAYALSLRVTFLSCALLALVLCVILLPVSIPDLPSPKHAETSKSYDEPSANEERAV